MGSISYTTRLPFIYYVIGTGDQQYGADVFWKTPEGTPVQYSTLAAAQEAIDDFFFQLDAMNTAGKLNVRIDKLISTLIIMGVMENGDRHIACIPTYSIPDPRRVDKPPFDAVNAVADNEAGPDPDDSVDMGRSLPDVSETAPVDIDMPRQNEVLAWLLCHYIPDGYTTEDIVQGASDLATNSPKSASDTLRAVLCGDVPLSTLDYAPVCKAICREDMIGYIHEVSGGDVQMLRATLRDAGLSEAVHALRQEHVIDKN